MIYKLPTRDPDECLDIITAFERGGNLPDNTHIRIWRLMEAARIAEAQLSGKEAEYMPFHDDLELAAIIERQMPRMPCRVELITDRRGHLTIWTKGGKKIKATEVAVEGDSVAWECEVVR